jgi:hypothetical protein
MRIVLFKDFESFRNGEDYTPAVKKALESIAPEEEATLIFEPKKYRFDSDQAEKVIMRPMYHPWGEKAIVFPLFNRKNLTIDGNGAEFIFTGTTSSFIIEYCENITLKNFSIDYDRPFYSEGVVVDSGKDFFELDIDKKKFPYRISEDGLSFYSDFWVSHPKAGYFCTEYEPKTKSLAYGHDYFIMGVKGTEYPGATTIEKLEFTEENRIRFQIILKQPLIKGNILTIMNWTRSPTGINIIRSKDMVLENINLYHCAGMGILVEVTENTTLKKVNVIPAPKSGRTISIPADATHFNHCLGFVKMEDCVFEGMLDDATNIHGFYSLFEEKIDDYSAKIKYVAAFVHNLFDIGDELQFIAKNDFSTHGCTHIESIVEFDYKYVIVKFKEPIPEDAKVGMVVSNLTKELDIVELRNIITGKNRPRGFLITTAAKVIIEGCAFYNSDCAVDFTGDANYWYESGPVRDVTIRNNHFFNCGHAFFSAAICIRPVVMEGHIPYHSGIKVYDNVFEGFTPAMIEGHHAKDVEFYNNTYIENNDLYPHMEGKKSVNVSDITFKRLEI